MPFGALTMSEQRSSLVEEIHRGEHSLSAVCRFYEVSRPTAYKWLKRSALGEDMCGRHKAPLHRPPLQIRDMTITNVGAAYGRPYNSATLCTLCCCGDGRPEAARPYNNYFHIAPRNRVLEYGF